MENCINLSTISLAANCLDYDNRGGILAKIAVCYHADVAVFPDLPGSSNADGMDVETAGKLVGNLILKSGRKMVEIPFTDGEGEISISITGDKGVRCAHYELEILRSKINAKTLGLMNAFKDAKLVIIAIDANGNKYLLGDKIAPCYLVDGDGAKSGRARTDRNATTMNFEYYGLRSLLYDGDLDSLIGTPGHDPVPGKEPDYIIYGNWTIGYLAYSPLGVVPASGGSRTLTAIATRTRKQHYTDGSTSDLGEETAQVSDFSVVVGNASISGKVITFPSVENANDVVVKAQYESAFKTITINQMGISTVEYAKRGASANEPTSVETEDKVALVNSPTEIKITTTSADRCRSQWVAVINTSKWRVTKVVDNDNDTVDFEEKAIGNYRVYHATSAGAINNTYTFTLTKI